MEPTFRSLHLHFSQHRLESAFLTKAIIERCLETELEAHLGYPKHGRRETGTGNARHGTSRKKLKGTQGEIEITMPRDRQASGSAAAGSEASDSRRRALRTKSWLCMPVE